MTWYSPTDHSHRVTGTAKGSFDNLVGKRERCRRDIDAERLRSLRVDNKLERR